MTIEEQVRELRAIVNELITVCQHYGENRGDDEARQAAEHARSLYTTMDQRLRFEK